MNRYRLLVVSLAGMVLVLLGTLVFGNLNRNLVYFLTPDEALSRQAEFDDGRRFQLAGLVREGTVQRTADGLRFVVTSGEAPGSAAVRVVHHGAPAQLFQPGIGVVLEGSWRGQRFVSDTMIVKHDEEYRAPAAGTGGGAS